VTSIRKPRRSDAVAMSICGGRLCTWCIGEELTAYDGDSSEPRLFHEMAVEFSDRNTATQISSVTHLLDIFSSRGCSAAEEVSRDPETFARIVSTLIFQESGVRVITPLALEGPELEKYFQIRLIEHRPRVVNDQLLFAVRHWPPPLGPDGTPLALTGDLPAFEPTSWTVYSVTINLHTGSATRLVIPRCTVTP
jgi:hypothetical protein